MNTLLRHLWRLLLPMVLLLPTPSWAHHGHGDKNNQGLRDVTVLIVRHAEKPAAGSGLSAQGQLRAEAYASYFDPLQLDGASLHPSRLIATSDTSSSQRPRLTLEPLSQRLQLPIEQSWSDGQVDQLVKSLRKHNQAPVVLIAWHHGKIDKLIDAFGADAKSLTGHKNWPGDVFGWLIVLRFDNHGQWQTSGSELVHEHLLPGDGH